MSEVYWLLPIEGPDDNLETKELIPFKFSVTTWSVNAVEKKKFSNNFPIIRSFLRISSHLLKKSLTESFIFSAVKFCENGMISEIYGHSLQGRFQNHVKYLRLTVLLRNIKRGLAVNYFCKNAPS